MPGASWMKSQYSWLATLGVGRRLSPAVIPATPPAGIPTSRRSPLMFGAVTYNTDVNGGDAAGNPPKNPAEGAQEEEGVKSGQLWLMIAKSPGFAPPKLTLLTAIAALPVFVRV